MPVDQAITFRLVVMVPLSFFLATWGMRTYFRAASRRDAGQPIRDPEEDTAPALTRLALSLKQVFRRGGAAHRVEEWQAPREGLTFFARAVSVDNDARTLARELLVRGECTDGQRARRAHLIDALC